VSYLADVLGPGTTVENYSPDSDYWYHPVAGPTNAGVTVAADSAMRLAAVHACVKILAEDVAKLPLIIYKRTPEGKERADDHPLAGVLRHHPNPWQSGYDFREMLQGHLGLRGNGYAQILPGAAGAIDQLIPLHPDRVKPKLLPNQRVLYKILTNQGTQTLSQDEVFHVRNLSIDNGPEGMNPIQYFREAIALGLAADAYASRFFANDATPSGTLESAGTLDEEAAKRLRKSWQDAHTGDHAHKVAVLEGGIAFKPIGISHKDAQFIEVRQFQVIEIARFYRMPLHKVNELIRSTYSNIEQQSIEYVTDCLLPWLRRWEASISRDLIADDQYFAEFLVDGLLRGDVKSRYEAHASSIQWGWRSVNEVREIENMNGIGPAGDVYLQPLNMTPAGSQPIQTAPQSPEPVPTDPLAPGEEARSQPITIAAFLLLAHDAAERLAAAELRELEKRAPHAAADPPRFRQWVAGFYAAQRAYVAKTLTPLAQAAGAAAAVLTPLLEGIASSGMAAAEPGNLAVLAEWRIARTAEIAGLIGASLQGSLGKRGTPRTRRLALQRADGSTRAFTVVEAGQDQVTITAVSEA
jgi:HK97 family phage portal protein